MSYSEISHPLNGAVLGKLVVPHGMVQLELSTLDDVEKLFQAELNQPEPKIDVENGRVHVVYPHFSISYIIKRPQTSHLALNGCIPWSFGFAQGLKGLHGDLRKLTLTDLFVKGGAVDVDLLLPKPSGNVTIRFTGGVRDITLKRPTGAEVRFAIKGGATHIRFDKQHAVSIGGGLSWQSSGFDKATDRYDIEIGGGATHITIAEED